MITITPQGSIYLCKTPLESDYKNQLTFANATAQETYFTSKVYRSFNNDNFTYLKKDNSITIGCSVDDIIECNYLFYVNTGFTNKIYYCFIKNMEYVNENVTRIFIETDVFQTYQFDINYHASFVEREHVSNDTIGLHTIPEDLETGGYVRQATDETPTMLTNLHYLTNTYIIIATTELGQYALPSYPTGKVFNGVYSGLYYFVFRNAYYADNFVKATQSMSTGDIIASIFVAPASLTNVSAGDFDTYTLEGYTVEMAPLNASSNELDMGDFPITKPSVIDVDYVPRNNKLWCYPYRYFVLSNNAGNTQEYKYELFTTESCKFNLRGAIGVGCSIQAMPKDYKEGSTLYALDAYKLPTCAWTNDAYINWITQNSVNLKLEKIKDYASIGVGSVLTIATGGAGALIGGGLIAGGVSGIFDTMKAKYEHSLAPNSAKGGANQGDLNFARQRTFTFAKMSIKKEYAEIIDKYFDMFGYRVNMVKTPNITGRTNWNYVKTIDCNFDGNIPQDYMKTIRNIFDNGITLWHNPSTMYDYTQSNTIVS